MNRYVALFRGINVGGKNLFPMKDLVRVFEDLGLRNVKTYIQSGNVVFQAPAADASALPRKILAATEKACGFRPDLILLTREELKRAIAANPFPQAASEPNTLHATFLASVPKNPDIATLENLRASSERFQLKETVFYLHAPDGIGRSKLAARIEKSLGVPGTSRNWRTVSKLADMADRCS